MRKYFHGWTNKKYGYYKFFYYKGVTFYNFFLYKKVCNMYVYDKETMKLQIKYILMLPQSFILVFICNLFQLFLFYSNTNILIYVMIFETYH